MLLHRWTFAVPPDLGTGRHRRVLAELFKHRALSLRRARGLRRHAAPAFCLRALGEHGYSKGLSPRPEANDSEPRRRWFGARRFAPRCGPANRRRHDAIAGDPLRQRFGNGRVCVVADRGMISAATIAALEERRLEYILGASERSEALVKRNRHGE